MTTEEKIEKLDRAINRLIDAKIEQAMSNHAHESDESGAWWGDTTMLRCKRPVSAVEEEKELTEAIKEMF